MNAKRRETLDVIEQALDEMLVEEQISVSDYSYQIILLVYDFIEAKDNLEALRLIAKADEGFISRLHKYKNKKGKNEKRIYKVYVALGLEYCVPKLGGSKN